MYAEEGADFHHIATNRWRSFCTMYSFPKAIDTSYPAVEFRTGDASSAQKLRYILKAAFTDLYSAIRCSMGVSQLRNMITANTRWPILYFTRR